MSPLVKRARAQARSLIDAASLAAAATLRETKARLTGKRVVRLLLISDRINYTSEQQLAPFRRFADALFDQLGLVTHYMSATRARSISPARLRKYDLVGLKFSFRGSEPAALAVATHVHGAVAGTATRIVYFDGDDDLNVLWPSLLPLCDLYVKKHAYRDRAEYGVPRIGKSNLTDYAAREHGWSFADNEIPRSTPVDPAQAAKIVVGWNIGLDDKIAALAARMPAPSLDRRPVDVCSRAVVSPQNWLFALRGIVATRLEAMAGTMNVLVPRNRVAQDEYYREMLSSTICVSPFGFGELCWRDFEAILCGCLLVKPDMGHVETAPDIFVPGVTYVPVKWDYSDLAEVCAHYLANDAERRAIVSEAYARVMQSQTPAWFVDRVAGLIARHA